VEGYEFFKVRAIEAPAGAAQALRSAWSNVVLKMPSQMTAQETTSGDDFPGASGESGAGGGAVPQETIWMGEKVVGAMLLLGLVLVLGTCCYIYVSSRDDVDAVKHRGVELSGGTLLPTTSWRGAFGVGGGQSRSPPEKGLVPDGMVGFDPKSFDPIYLPLPVR
jgi:hypothetical protein